MEQDRPRDAGGPTAKGLSPVYRLIPELGRLRDEVLFGQVWPNPNLGERDRSLVTCAILAAQARTDELAVHIRRAVDNGVTLDEVRGMAVHVAFYAGWPAGMAIGKAAQPLLEAAEAAGEGIE